MTTTALSLSSQFLLFTLFDPQKRKCEEKSVEQNRTLLDLDINLDFFYFLFLIYLDKGLTVKRVL